MWLSTESELVHAPVQQVWEVVRDVTRLPEWHHFFSVVDLAQTPHGAARGHGRYLPRGWSRQIHARTAGDFTASVGGLSVVLRQPQPGRGEQIFSWWVAESEGGTRIIQRVRVVGLLAPIFARLAGRPSARGFAADVRRLAALVSR